jgi:superfamily II DNA or RNA helicase
MNKREQVQTEALEEAIKHKRVGLGISMGVGKTLIGLRYIDHYQKLRGGKLNILVVAPKLSIFDSWKNDSEKFDVPLDNVHFTTYLSLNKQEKIYDIIILDECHSLLYSHEEYLAEFPGRILGLTGTPPKWHKSEKGEMVSTYCPIRYKYITDEAVEDNILNDYKIVVHMLRLSSKRDIEVDTRKGSFYTSEIANYAYWTSRIDEATSPKSKQIASVMRMKSMMDYRSKERYAEKLFNQIDEKCILFANTQNQADRLCGHSYHSNNPDSPEILESFSNGSITKMSSVLQLNEGVNIPGLKAGIIMHAYGNERKSSQRIGRLLRLNPTDTAVVHILCYADTVDEKWAKSALSDFDSSKITYKDAYQQELF